MSDHTSRAAIVGCGRIASTIEDEMRTVPGWQPLPYSHAGAYRRAEGVHLVAAADPDPDRLTAFGDRWDVADRFADAEQMLAAVEPDIVSICTPTATHADLVSLAVRHGVRGIVLEKPVSISLAEADRIAAETQAAGTVVAINHTRTYDPIYSRGRELIKDGLIGRPHTIFSTWGEGWSFGGSHLFDLLRSYLDSTPTSVFCVGEPGPDPGGDAYVVYESGVRAFISAPRQPTAPLEIDVIGTDGRLRLGNFSIQLFRNQGGIPVEYPFFGRMEMRSAMTLLVEDVLAGIRTGRPVVSGIPEGRQALEIAVALNESARLGTPVRLPVTDTSLGVQSL